MDIPIASASLDFLTLSLYEQLNALNNENKAESLNLFFSPFSVSTALSMTLPGARNDTENQLKWLLGSGRVNTNQILALNKLYLTTIDFINQSDEEDLNIKTVNRVYVNENLSLKAEYSQTLAQVYGAGADQVDFSDSKAAAAKINGFVSENTNNKIRNLIHDSILNESTRLVLVNAIYFKAQWRKKFEKDQTAKENFYLSDGSVKRVDMMKKFGERFKYLSAPGGLGANTLEIPYMGETISLTIILPNENTPIADIERELNANIIHEIVSARRGTFNHMDKVNLQLPKFKIEFKTEVNKDYLAEKLILIES
jgi:serpin B